MKKNILFAVSICLIFFLYVLSLTAQNKMLWDDDLKLIKAKQDNLDKQKVSGQYIPFAGKTVLRTFFDDSIKVFYSYPEQKAKFIIESEGAYKGKNCIRIFLPAGEYTGAGLMSFPILDLSDKNTMETGYLQFFIKLESSIKDLNIALVQNEKPRYESVLKLEKYADKNNKKWQEVKIPLKDFPKAGSCWDMDTQKAVNGNLNWKDISEIKFFYLDKSRIKTEFLLDEVNIKYDGIDLVTFAPIFRDSLNDLMYYYTYPEATSKLKETDIKYAGIKAIKLDLDPKEYSGAGLGISGINIEKQRDKLALEFWIKGEKGGEKIQIGLSDGESDKMKCKVLLPLEKYIIVTKEWQEVNIPLKDFPAEGGFFDGQKVIKSPFQYNDVIEMNIDSNAKENKDCIIYLDDIRIKNIN